jgi:metallo-beta-lactamase family protein
MKLTFHGAVRSVTGSRHLIETEGNRVLLDRVFFPGVQRENTRKDRQ